MERDAIDRVVLDADERHRRRIVLTGENGTIFPARSAASHDRCATATGWCSTTAAIVRVAGKPEALVEITAATPHELARLAWHLGNRHTDVQIVGDKLRIRRDHVLEDMLRGLGRASRRSKRRSIPRAAPRSEPGYATDRARRRLEHGDGS